MIRADDLSQSSWMPSTMWSLETYLLLALATLTLISNSLSILAIVCRNRKITRMYFFLLHLSIADGLTAILTLGPELLWPLFDRELFQLIRVDLACRILKFVEMLAPYLSSYVLVMMAWDRHQSICNPMRHRVWKPNESLLKIVLAYCTAFLLCAPQIFVFGANGKMQCVAHLGQNRGWLARSYVAWLCVSHFLLPLLLLSVLLLRICHALNLRSTRSTLHKHCCLMLADGASTVSSISVENDMRPRLHSSEANFSKAKMRSVHQTTVIISSFVSCSLPVVAVQFYNVAFGAEDDTQSFGSDCYMWLVALKSILNPWIYIILNRDLRQSLSNLFLGPCQPNRRSNSLENANGRAGGAVRRRAFTLEADAAGHTTVGKSHKVLRVQLSQPIVIQPQNE